MTTHNQRDKIKVLKCKKTGHLFDVVNHVMTNWAGHKIYSLISRDNQESRTIADFAVHHKFEVHERS